VVCKTVDMMSPSEGLSSASGSRSCCQWERWTRSVWWGGLKLLPGFGNALLAGCRVSPQYTSSWKHRTTAGGRRMPTV